MNSRVKYIDNLRTLAVALLVPYHLAMAYNTWGEANYIFFDSVRPIASIVVFISPWFMPLLFLLAGVGSFHSLNKRGYGLFIKERLIRLGIPLVFGVLFLNPILSYVADTTNNGFSGTYFGHYAVYFTRFTDLSGYDGGFALGHLWFILLLLVISVLSLGMIKLLPETSEKKQKLVSAVLILVSIAAFYVKFAGKPLITYLCVYLLGYYLFSDGACVGRLAEYKWTLMAVFLLTSVMNTILFVYTGQYRVLNNICSYLSFASGVPALLCLGYEYLNSAGGFSHRCSKLSYAFYIIHLPVTVLCQYFISLTGAGTALNFTISFVIATGLTVTLCVLADTNKVTRMLFGLRK